MLGAFLATVICIGGATAYFAPGFVRTMRKAMSLPRFNTYAHVEGAAAQLQDGRILIVGSCVGDKALNAELYDPKTNTFERVAPMRSQRMFHPLAICMSDGRILAAGGSKEVAEDVLDLEAYDPARNQWSVIGRIPKETRLSDGVNLPNGKVLFSTEEGGVDGLLLFDPRSGELHEVGSPAMAVNGTPLLSNLGNGRILVTHLDYGNRIASRSNAFMFEADSDQTMVLPYMRQDRAQHEATTLADGRVLISGGSDSEPSAELFDPQKASFTPTGEMVAPRCLHVATRMNDGRVLIVGGVPSVTSAGLPTPDEMAKMSPQQIQEAFKKARPSQERLSLHPEVFDPAAGTFTPLPDPPSPIHTTRAGLHLAMTDGRVLFLSLRGPLYFDSRSNAWSFPPASTQH